MFGRLALSSGLGTYAEYSVVPEDGVVTGIPAELDFIDAAAMPVAGLTAMGVLEELGLPRRAALLIIGATGGVGSSSPSSPPEPVSRSWRPLRLRSPGACRNSEHGTRLTITLRNPLPARCAPRARAASTRSSTSWETRQSSLPCSISYPLGAWSCPQRGGRHGCTPGAGAVRRAIPSARHARDARRVGPACRRGEHPRAHRKSPSDGEGSGSLGGEHAGSSSREDGAHHPLDIIPRPQAQ